MTAQVDAVTALLNRLRTVLGPPAPIVENGSRPLYATVLRLRHLEPGKLACAVFFEGSMVLAMLLAFTDLVSWYGVLTLPATVAAMVKLNDLIAGRLPNPHAPRRPSRLGTVPTPASEPGGRVATFDEATTQLQELPRIDRSP